MIGPYPTVNSTNPFYKLAVSFQSPLLDVIGQSLGSLVLPLSEKNPCEPIYPTLDHRLDGFKVSASQDTSSKLCIILKPIAARLSKLPSPSIYGSFGQ